MGNDLEAAFRGHRADFDCLGKAADSADIGLEYVDLPAIREVEKLIMGVLPVVVNSVRTAEWAETFSSRHRRCV